MRLCASGPDLESDIHHMIFGKMDFVTAHGKAGLDELVEHLADVLQMLVECAVRRNDDVV